MENYWLTMEREIAALGGRKPSLLLHSCCGPCSTWVLDCLTPHFDVALLYYNPNIQPEREYDLRLEHQRRVLEHHPEVRLLPCEYDGGAFISAARGLEREPEGGERCTACFRLRLGEAVRRAAEGGFEYVTTTLSVSPHKDAVRLNEIGRELADKAGVRWLAADFKKRDGYKRSIELSREYELYRQNYCGCVFSRSE